MNNQRAPTAALRARTRGRVRTPWVTDIPRLRRFAVAALACVCIVLALFMLWVTDDLERARIAVWQGVVDASVRQGLVVRYLELNGRVRGESDILGALIALKPGDPMLAIDLKAMRDRLKTNPWVAQARIERHWPDRVIVTLSERVPFAQWDDGAHTVLIDRTGHVLTRQVPDDLTTLVVLATPALPDDFAVLVDALAATPLMHGKHLTARWVAGRRWDLHLAKGPVIALPQDDIPAALIHLDTVAREHTAWDRTLAAIDLRAASERIIVRPIDDAAPVAFDGDLTHKDSP